MLDVEVIREGSREQDRYLTVLLSLCGQTGIERVIAAKAVIKGYIYVMDGNTTNEVEESMMEWHLIEIYVLNGMVWEG